MLGGVHIHTTRGTLTSAKGSMLAAYVQWSVGRTDRLSEPWASLFGPQSVRGAQGVIYYHLRLRRLTEDGAFLPFPKVGN
jgi:hypothetical protein